MRKQRIDESTRRLLIRLASRSTTRTNLPTPERPSHWNPFSVPNPEALDLPFNDLSAWSFVVNKLEQEHPVEIIELHQPPGATGYVMTIQLETGTEPLYVKLEVRPDQRIIFGRSFHYSTR